MRSPAEMDIIVIDITNRCFLRCSNCTRAIAHQTSTRELTPDQLRAALRSLRGWWAPGKVVGLIGGEPTLHSEFEAMCQVFREEWNPGANPQHGREPIADFDQFATQRLFDRTNGRGLWTSFGPRFLDHYETVMDTFSHWNPNDHTAGGVHQTGLVDAKEMCEALGIPWEEFPKYRDACWVQNTWSGSVTPKGAYFCEHAGTLDLLYNDGKHAWPIEEGWWKRKPEEFGDQIHLCELCSLCLPGPSQTDSRDRDIIGAGHRLRLEMVGSPAVKGGRYDLFDPAVHVERRKVDTKDNYTAGPRVSPDNRSMMPRKLSAIVTCVGRAEQLLKTIEHNRDQVDELVVVTHCDDDLTKMTLIAAHAGEDYRSRIKRVISSRCHDGAHGFNKGALLNDGLRALASDADWIVFTDADVFLPDNLREYVRTHALNPGVLYGAMRDNGTPGLPGVNDGQPNGFFQLFNRRAHAIRDTWPSVMSEAFCSAGGIDSWFLARWPRDKQVMIPELAVRHIAHGEELGAGWNGPQGGAPRWRQIGMMNPNGFIPINGCPPPGLISGRLRLVDTLLANVWEGEIKDGELPAGLLESNASGLKFNGHDIGWNHIHVAMWS